MNGQILEKKLTTTLKYANIRIFTTNKEICLNTKSQEKECNLKKNYHSKLVFCDDWWQTPLLCLKICELDTIFYFSSFEEAGKCTHHEMLYFKVIKCNKCQQPLYDSGRHRFCRALTDHIHMKHLGYALYISSRSSEMWYLWTFILWRVWHMNANSSS